MFRRPININVSVHPAVIKPVEESSNEGKSEPEKLEGVETTAEKSSLLNETGVELSSKIVGFITSHVVLYVTLLLFTSASIKIFLLSGRDPDTAIAVLGSLDSLGLFKAFAISSVPILLSVLLFLASYYFVFLAWENPSRRRTVLTVLGVLAFLALSGFLVPLSSIVIAAAFSISVCVLLYRVRRSLIARNPSVDKTPEALSSIKIFDIIALTALILLVFSNLKFWVPAETLVTNSGNVVGYVLNTNDSEFEILRITKSSRVFERVPIGEVQSRFVCNYEEEMSWAISPLWKANSNTPVCAT